MTTAGYGDVPLKNLWEMWIVIIMEFVGLVFMAIALMTNILANFNLQRSSTASACVSLSDMWRARTRQHNGVFAASMSITLSESQFSTYRPR